MITSQRTFRGRGAPRWPAYAPNKQFIGLASLTFAGYSMQQALAPAAIVGCIFKTDLRSAPSSYAVTVNGDGTVILAAGGDTSRQSFVADCFDLTTEAFYGQFTVYINEVGPIWINGLGLPAVIRVPITPVNLNTLASSPSGDALSFAVASGTLPPGITLVAGVLAGTPTGLGIGTYIFTFSATDSTGTATISPVSYMILVSESAGFRVTAVSSGFYGGVFRTQADVFDILYAADYSDSTQNYQSAGGEYAPGWMLQVASTTPLLNWQQSNGAPYFPPQDPARRFVY